MSSKTQQKQTLSTAFMHSFVQLQVNEALPLVETLGKTMTQHLYGDAARGPYGVGT